MLAFQLFFFLSLGSESDLHTLLSIGQSKTTSWAPRVRSTDTRWPKSRPTTESTNRTGKEHFNRTPSFSSSLEKGSSGCECRNPIKASRFSKRTTTKTTTKRERETSSKRRQRDYLDGQRAGGGVTAGRSAKCRTVKRPSTDSSPSKTPLNHSEEDELLRR